MLFSVNLLSLKELKSVNPYTSLRMGFLCFRLIGNILNSEAKAMGIEEETKDKGSNMESHLVFCIYIIISRSFYKQGGLYILGKVE